MSIKKHYDEHLAEHYSWMLGDFEQRVKETEHFFLSHHIRPGSSRLALDLGAGSGLHAIPLARLGFSVKAVDLSLKMLGELKQRAGHLDIECVEADLQNFSIYRDYQPELIVCMGDTLTHLDNLHTVELLIQHCYQLLPEGGKLILSFRDLNHELQNVQRFIPVRSDENRIFTCFLEFFGGYVNVYDIINEKKDGQWLQKVSTYKKLKLSAIMVRDICHQAGFELLFEEINGLVTLILQK